MNAFIIQLSSVILLLFSLSSSPLSAQEMLRRGNAKERVMRYTQGRNDFIFDQADLEQQEQLFVTQILAKYDSKRHKIWSDNYILRQGLRGKDNLTDNDYREALEQHVKTLKQMAEYNEDLIEELSKKLSYQKVFRIVMSERNYTKGMFDIHEKTKHKD